MTRLDLEAQILSKPLLIFILEHQNLVLFFYVSLVLKIHTLYQKSVLCGMLDFNCITP